MTAIKQIYAEFFRQRISPMRAFSRDKRVDSFVRSPFHLATCAARHHTDPLANRRTTRNDHRLGANRRFKPLLYFLQWKAGPCHQSEMLVLIEKKWLAVLQAENGAQLRVVAELGVHVQREVRTVNRQIASDQKPQHFVGLAGPGMARVPKQPMMHQQKVG